MTPIERVAALLTEAHYRRLDAPIKIGTLKFEVGAALVGTGHAADLVLVFDSAMTKDDKLRRCVEGVSRALDVVGSRRPLTSILVGPSPSTSLLSDLSRSSRVLPIGLAGTAPNDQDMRDWLSALLPLEIPAAALIAESPLLSLAAANEQDPVATSLLRAARSGPEAVSGEFIKRIEEALSQPVQGEGQ
jgi:hypothetical protein